MVGPAMTPQLHDGMDALGGGGHQLQAAPAVATAAVVAATSSAKRKAGDATDEDAAATALYGDLPESKRRKFILVDDAQRNNRVRVRVTLDQVDMNEMPDSYRRANSVYPRTYYPMQMQDSAEGAAARDPRFTMGVDDDDDDDEVDGEVVGGESATVGRTLVPVPLLEGGQRVPVPRISRAKKRRENVLNELGYRMSWSQSRVFAGRILFLQKSRTFLALPLHAYHFQTFSPPLVFPREKDVARCGS